MSSTPCVRLTPDELARISLFADDDRPALQWLADHFAVQCYESGDIIVHEGSPAKDFVVILEGELHYRRTGDPYARLCPHRGPSHRRSSVSRIKVIGGRGVAVGRTRVAVMPATELRELVYRAPNLAQKLVGEMTDRTREFVRGEERTAKMLALGKLSAGLAHELNNPASAALRSATLLREALNNRRAEAIALHGQVISRKLRT